MLTFTHYLDWWREKEVWRERKEKNIYSAAITAVYISFQLEALRFSKLSITRQNGWFPPLYSNVFTISPLYQLAPLFYRLLASLLRIQCFVPAILLHRCRSSLWHIQDEKLKDFSVYEEMKMGLGTWPRLILRWKKKCDITYFKHIPK